jgi:capsular polysaccharide biosynthesis protein
MMEHREDTTASGWMRAIAARWVVIVAAVVAGVIAALVISFLMPRQEGASATVLPVAAGGALDPASGDLPRVAGSVQLLAQSDPVLQRAAEIYAASGPGRSAPPLEDMRSRISATIPGEGALVTIRATAATSEEAVALGQAELEALSGIVAALTPAGSNGPGVSISAVGPPMPMGVVSPRPIANAVLGGVAGLFLGLGIVLLLPGVRRTGAASRARPMPAGGRPADEITRT